MIVKPKVRGFVCITAHPEGCAAHVKEQVDFVKSQPKLQAGPKRSLIIGSSTGYGLSSRIVAALGCGADTLGIFFERPAANGRPASAGWYNSIAVTRLAQANGQYAGNINGDAFSAEIKAQAIALIKEKMGTVDEVIYSLASPRRTDPVSGEVYKSVLKPVGAPFTAITVDTDKHLVQDVSLEPATDEDILATQKVMGGEDWKLWIEALSDAGVLAHGCKTVAYSYIGPEVTWPIYKNGTIGLAKQHLDTTAIELDKFMKTIGGLAVVSVNKAVVTQASSAIPVVPLYLSALIKIMKRLGTNEGCIEQIQRLYADHLYSGKPLKVDEVGRVRVDDLELRPEVQAEINALWPKLSTETLRTLTNYDEYGLEFLKLFGFGLSEVDYDAETEIELELPV